MQEKITGKNSEYTDPKPKSILDINRYNDRLIGIKAGSNTDEPSSIPQVEGYPRDLAKIEELP